MPRARKDGTAAAPPRKAKLQRSAARRCGEVANKWQFPACSAVSVPGRNEMGPGTDASVFDFQKIKQPRKKRRFLKILGSEC